MIFQTGFRNGGYFFCTVKDILNLDKNCPIFKPMEVGNHNLKFSNDANDLMKTLTNKIAQLDLSNKASSSNRMSVNMIEEITPENVEQIQAMFEENNP